MMGESMITRDLRFGVIGWGYWGPKIARNLDAIPQAMVSMVADTDANRLVSLGVNQHRIQITTQVEDIFRSDIDAVVIATPVRTHFQLAREALLHDKHVLVEKPLTAIIRESEQSIPLAHKLHRILLMGHTLPHTPTT